MQNGKKFGNMHQKTRNNGLRVKLTRSHLSWFMLYIVRKSLLYVRVCIYIC